MRSQLSLPIGPSHVTNVYALQYYASISVPNFGRVKPPPEVVACFNAAGSRVKTRKHSSAFASQHAPLAEPVVSGNACNELDLQIRMGRGSRLKNPAAELRGILLSLRKGRLNSRSLTPEQAPRNALAMGFKWKPGKRQFRQRQLLAEAGAFPDRCVSPCSVNASTLPQCTS
jgi:hypothetical protein